MPQPIPPGDPTSLQRALAALNRAGQEIQAAITELGQLDRCAHDDYPYGTPPLMRCTLQAGHEGPHRYPDLGWTDGGKCMHELDVDEQLRIMRTP